jgi:Mg2+ and Co2+ transporter CorA
MDLLQVQEELNIIIQIMEQQIELITDLQAAYNGTTGRKQGQSQSPAKCHRHHAGESLPHPDRATYRQYSFSTLTDPISQLLENLQREYVDLCDLRENSNALINRTIQLVNIRLEDHGKAILVFTIVTIIFLPLSFISSFFGMNFSDIRNMRSTQRLFWIISGSLTVGTVGLAILLAFYGGAIMEWFFGWRENRRRRIKPPDPSPRRMTERRQGVFRNFEVLDVGRPGRNGLFP